MLTLLLLLPHQSCDNVPIIRSPVCDQGRAVSPPKADGLSDCSHAMTYWEVSSKVERTRALVSGSPGSIWPGSCGTPSKPWIPQSVIFPASNEQKEAIRVCAAL